MTDRPLGENQRYCLEALKRHGGKWFDGCGWYWDNPSGTVRIMQSLVRRGLVTIEKRKVSSPYYAADVYRLKEQA